MNLFTLVAKLGLDTSEYEKGLTQSKKSMSDYRKDVMTLAQTFKKQGMSMSDAMKKAYSEIDKSMYDFTSKSEEAAEKSAKHWTLFGKLVEKSGTESFERLSEVAIAKATAIGHIIANITERVARAVIDLGKNSIQASADIEAEIALYEQVFGELESAAGGVLESIGKDTNILATRLRGIGTSAFMQFRGAGVDAASALAAMDKYTRLAADAAAAYNISIEDADVKLRSFLRGNTEAGDSIGLFTSESQRNERAIAAYGAKWTELTEAQKQMLMLNVVDEIYTQQEILGQAAREGHEWENVIGNLNNAFKNLQGTIGSPFREALIPVIESLTGFFGDDTVVMRIGMLASSLGETAGKTFDGVIALLDELLKWSTGESDNATIDAGIGIIQAIGSIAGETFKGAINFMKWLLGGMGESTSENVQGFLQDFNELVNSDGFKNAAIVVGGLVTAWAGLHSPLLLVGTALAVIVTRVEDIKKWAEEAKKRLDDFIHTHVPEGFLSAVKTGLQTVASLVNSISAVWNSFMNSLSSGKAEQGIANVQAAMNEGGIASGIGTAVKESWWGKLLSGGSSESSGISGEFGGSKSGTSSAEAGRTFEILPGRAVGLDYVPYNDYLARLHEGEAVLTKAEATNWRRGESTGTIDTACIASAVAVAVREALDGVGVYMGAERVGDLVTARVSRNIAKNTWNRRYQPV